MGSGSGYISMLENACMNKSKNTNLQSWLNPSYCREKEEQEKPQNLSIIPCNVLPVTFYRSLSLPLSNTVFSSEMKLLLTTVGFSEMKLFTAHRFQK